MIYETDGMANQGSTPGNGFSAAATTIQLPDSARSAAQSAGYSQTACFRSCRIICNDMNGNPVTGPGSRPSRRTRTIPASASPGKPVTIQCVAFGGIFETPSSTLTSSVGSAPADLRGRRHGLPLQRLRSHERLQVVHRHLDQRQTRLVQAFQTIMNMRPVPITLIR